MDLSKALIQFNRQAQAIHSLLANVSEEQMRWKPTPEQWSLLEVLNHLESEERMDFRVRLDMLLNYPGADWLPIDPARWVTEQGFNQRDPQESLAKFETERQKSITWLGNLKNPDWTRGDKTPWGGKLTAGDMLASWLAHDLLHLRQITELLYAWTRHAALPHSPDYAGEW
jgi:hypothetical protein